MNENPATSNGKSPPDVRYLSKKPCKGHNPPLHIIAVVDGITFMVPYTSIGREQYVSSLRDGTILKAESPDGLRKRALDYIVNKCPEKVSYRRDNTND
ncbi:hypothetical protein HYW76_00010 [Candidatus Pacearchaeota archaeon]|nr:hypothetical protein [Candidatus Pacearchaeota archaeon]